jgi:2-iminobutanoate/2-iminopropanoate deaminase
MSEAISTKLAPLPRGFYSQAVRAGDFLFIAGQLPIDQQGQIVGESMAEQAEQALSNVRTILEAAGGDLADLVQCTIYISDIKQWQDVDEVYARFLSAIRVPPARAVVPVKEMHYGALVEIQAVAHIPSRQARHSTARSQPV